MSVLLRALGAQAASALFRSLSPTGARAASLMFLLLANALPLMALLSGEWTAGDVLVAFWLENVAIGVWAAVRIATSNPGATLGGGGLSFNHLVRANTQSADPRTAVVVGQVIRAVMAAFFVVQYGLFTTIHGTFTFKLSDAAGTTGSAGGLVLLLLALLVSHGLSTAIHWFARGERHHVGPTTAMRQVYPRVVVMHLAVMGAGWLVLGGGNNSLPAALSGIAPGLLLIAIKVVVDVVAHLREHATGALDRSRPASVVA